MTSIRQPAALLFAVCFVATTILHPYHHFLPAQAFLLQTPPSHRHRISGLNQQVRRFVPQTCLEVSKLRDGPASAYADDDDDDDENSNLSDEDRALLQEVEPSQLIALCQQFDLDTSGTKASLLQRLRAHAATKVQEEKSRMENRKKRVEEGSDDDREKYEVVDESEDSQAGEDDGAYFYFESKEDFSKYETEQDKKKRQSPPVPVTRSTLTAPPPPPDVKPNEKGERVVTVYSTSDHNDLTGVAAAQPGQAATQDPMTGSVAEPENAPWDMEKQNQKADVTTVEMEAAKEELTELVSSLLSMTGAPGFQGDGDEEDDELYASVGFVRQQGRRNDLKDGIPEGFVGFDPTKVSGDMLTKASKSIQMMRGKILQDTIRQFELRAVGYDGAAGDDMTKGGGHYRQVSMVRTFLEGFRRTEVRHKARETATMLLDQLVSEGIDGLDITLSAMTRGGDDVQQEAGELNDSLIDYLNDAIRQQEKKVGQMVDTGKKVEELESAMTFHEDPGDAFEAMWTVEEEDGTTVESFDPKDPKNAKALKNEFQKLEANEAGRSSILPKSAPEKLLLLLKLLRERVKIEAAFANDEKSRNLRVLAYCLNLQSDNLRKELVTKEFGYSLDVRIRSVHA
ncbi:MAG: hypothetical protein SGILL_007095 [Bacillariaceae sp.]